jgi:hypothetical protein
MEPRPVPRVVYRVVEHDPAESGDFLSDEAAGLQAASYERPRHRRGMSTSARLSDARGLARLLKRRRGRDRMHIAAIAVEPGGPFRIEQSGPNRYHYTLWGDSAALAAHARIVETV